MTGGMFVQKLQNGIILCGPGSCVSVIGGLIHCSPSENTGKAKVSPYLGADAGEELQVGGW